MLSQQNGLVIEELEKKLEENINKYISTSLAFSIAIMIGISLFDLLPESMPGLLNRFKSFSLIIILLSIINIVVYEVLFP